MPRLYAVAFRPMQRRPRPADPAPRVPVASPLRIALALEAVEGIPDQVLAAGRVQELIDLADGILDRGRITLDHDKIARLAMLAGELRQHKREQQG